MLRLLALALLAGLAVPASAQDFQILSLRVEEPTEGAVRLVTTVQNNRRTASHYSVHALIPGATLLPAARSSERLEPGASTDVVLTFDASAYERPLTGEVIVRNHRRQEVDRKPFTLEARRDLPVRPAIPSDPPRPDVPRPTPPIEPANAGIPVELSDRPIVPEAAPVEAAPMEAAPVEASATRATTGSSLGFTTALLSDTYRTDQVIRSRRFIKAIKVLVQLENRGPEPWNAPVTLQTTAMRWEDGSSQRFGLSKTQDVTFDEPLGPGETLLVPVVLGQRVPGFGMRIPNVPIPGARMFSHPILIYDEALSWRDGTHFSVVSSLSTPRDTDTSDNGVTFEGSVSGGLDVSVQPAAVHRHSQAGTGTATTRPRD